jgi:hypothetical protein
MKQRSEENCKNYFPIKTQRLIHGSITYSEIDDDIIFEMIYDSNGQLW